ncbi:hypothetical protein [Mycolicibacterium sp.]
MGTLNGDEGAFGTNPRTCTHTNTAPLTDAEDECHDCGIIVARPAPWPPH